MSTIDLAVINKYLEGLLPERQDELIKMEQFAKETEFPIIGPAAGHFCYQIARITKAKRIFEMGSGYGYSTAWFAQAIKENGGGLVYHVEREESLSDSAKKHLEVLGYKDLVTYRLGEATQILENTDETFDIIFNDIDKIGYPGAFPVIKNKLSSGGILIVDNMLWYGKIFDNKNSEESTLAVHEFTKEIVQDKTWITSLIPIRDGLLFAMKL